MRPKEVLQKFVDAFNRADAEALSLLYAEDAINHQVPNEPVKGRANIKKMFEDEFSQAKMVCIVENMFEDGQWAIMEWRDPQGLRGCGFFQIVNDRIILQRGYWDKLSFLNQQGTAANPNPYQRGPGMKIEIREINAEEYPAVLPLWNNELGNRSVNAENIAPHYDRMKKDDNYKTFVALLDGEVAGFITTVQVMAVGFEAGYLKVNGLAVKKELQHKGIGTQLIRYAENLAKEKGLSSIILNSGFKRTGAHAFYEHNGFEKTSYCFVKEIRLP